VAADIQNHQQDLANSLATLGQGLAPYIQISQWGQWFAVQTVYTCLANQTVCPYYQPTNPPAGSGLGGGPPLSSPSSKATPSKATSPTTSASTTPTGSSTGSAGSLAASSVTDLLQVESGHQSTASSAGGGS